MTKMWSLCLGITYSRGVLTSHPLYQISREDSTIFAYRVKDPRLYGCEFDGSGKPVSIVEKPLKPRSNFVIPGIYIYDNQVVKIAKKPRAVEKRGLEISDVNVEYLRKGRLEVRRSSPRFCLVGCGYKLLAP